LDQSDAAALRKHQRGLQMPKMVLQCSREWAFVGSNPQKLSTDDVAKLRRAAGHWLKKLRETRGLSQRDLAAKVGIDYFTFISQLESGRGRIPPDRYRVWAQALGVEVREFVIHLMQFYDPVTYRVLFEDNAQQSE
jgi:ribosome-binding protein aMBF1 (putative translation factor)